MAKSKGKIFRIYTRLKFKKCILGISISVFSIECDICLTNPHEMFSFVSIQSSIKVLTLFNVTILLLLSLLYVVFTIFSEYVTTPSFTLPASPYLFPNTPFVSNTIRNITAIIVKIIIQNFFLFFIVVLFFLAFFFILTSSLVMKQIE